MAASKAYYDSHPAAKAKKNAYQKKYKPRENSVKASISSRFQTIILGSIISGLSKTERETVMLGLLKYGKSESEWSSAHYKAQ